MIERIPAIDIIDGKCVRLTKGDYAQKTVYHESPVEVAKEFEQLGAQRLHVVDLDGAKSKHIVNERVLREITTQTRLVVDFGGGIKTDEDMEKAFDKDLLPFLQYYIEKGVVNVLCTEISKDGTLAGPAIALYREVMRAYPQLHLIASGGVSSYEDIEALEAAGIPAVVFGKAIYEGKIDLKRLWV